MNTDILNQTEVVVFKRSKNLFRGLWNGRKNEMIIWQVSEYKRSFIIFFGASVATMVYLSFISELYKLIISSVILLIALREIVLYFFITKVSRIYKINEIIQNNSNIVFSVGTPEYRGEIPYQSIQKMSYSSRMIETIAGSFFSGLLSSASFYLRCFIIEYKGNDGKVSTLLIPLDLINLPNFLRTVIERSRLKRSQQSRLSLFAEWVKAQPNELITSQEQILRPTTMDPNVDITKPLLIILGVGFIAIFFFLISEYRMW